MYVEGLNRSINALGLGVGLQAPLFCGDRYGEVEGTLRKLALAFGERFVGPGCGDLGDFHDGFHFLVGRGVTRDVKAGLGAIVDMKVYFMERKV